MTMPLAGVLVPSYVIHSRPGRFMYTGDTGAMSPANGRKPRDDVAALLNGKQVSVYFVARSRRRVPALLDASLSRSGNEASLRCRCLI